MKIIEVLNRSQKEYVEASSFADRVYRTSLNAPIRKPPEFLIAAREGKDFCGCLGLSLTVQSTLFKRDQRYLRYAASLPKDIRVGEQNILAVCGFGAGVPILIACTVFFAQRIGLDKIAYAAIPVTRKAVGALGYKVTDLGETDLTVMDEQDQIRYRYWADAYRPHSFILETANAETVFRTVIARYHRKADASAVWPQQIAA